MAKFLSAEAQLIPFPQKLRSGENTRKNWLNTNKDGSVRNINGKVYVDFIYLEERVREPSGLVWNEKNAKHVRQQLDKIIVEIQSGTFKFFEVFPDSKKALYFAEKERLIYGRNKTPDEVLFKDYVWIWYDLLKDSGRISGRTLWGYKCLIDQYLFKFFSAMTFADFNKSVFDKFISWARRCKYRGKVIGNKSINKIFVPLKMICKDVSIEYGWRTYNPFFGFKKLPENDSYEKISPFSLAEQNKIIKCLSEHWKPYFVFAFCSGLRQGEQIAIKPGDIDWSNTTLKIDRAFTRDDNGKVAIGKTKNKYSRRVIKLIPVMIDALKAQKTVYDEFKCEYFFCSSEGKRIDRAHLRKRVWTPALKKACVEYREIKQTRHSFATNALSCGENPLWIAKVMGHRDTDMIIRVYGKYIENARGSVDGTYFNDSYQKPEINEE